MRDHSLPSLITRTLYNYYTDLQLHNVTLHACTVRCVDLYNSPTRVPYTVRVFWLLYYHLMHYKPCIFNVYLIHNGGTLLMIQCIIYMYM